MPRVFSFSARQGLGHCGFAMLLLILAPCAQAAASVESSAALGLFKVVASLGVIIVAIYLVVALMRRTMMAGGVGQNLPLRVRGGVMVGQRERVVVVEVKDTWLILGVTAAQVTLLHTLPREESALPPATDINPQLWVRQWLARRNAP